MFNDLNPGSEFTYTVQAVEPAVEPEKEKTQETQTEAQETAENKNTMQTQTEGPGLISKASNLLKKNQHIVALGTSALFTVDLGYRAARRLQ